MKSSASALKVEGIVPPIITPLEKQDTLDVAGLERMLEHLIHGGVQGIFSLGTTGESTCLSYRLRREVIQRTCSLVRGRVPVLVGITDTAVEESLSLGLFAAEAGAAAVVVAAPFQMPAGQLELRRYLQHLTACLPFPCVLYHCPPLTKTGFDIETVRWAIDQPRIVGLKDSSGDLKHFEQLCSFLPQRPSWRLFAGPEELLPATIAMGGHGGVCGGANLFPGLYVRLYQSIRAGDANATSELQEQVVAVGRGLYGFEQNPTSFIKGLKAALRAKGMIASSAMALPFSELCPEHQETLRANLSILTEAIEANGAFGSS